MHNDVPQRLVQAFVRSAQAAGSTESKERLAAACHSLIEAWSSSDRKYHGLHHVVELLTRVETLLPETGDPALVRLAAWFHGVCFSTSEEATYTHNGGENEEASALFAEAKLYELGVDPEKARRVATLIKSLRIKPSASPTETSRFQAIDIDEQALRDAHLGTLAVEPQKYKRYLELVRQEYEHIPREDFLRARRAIITRLLSRRQLFVTPLARQWDESARENLAAELQRINEVLPEANGDTPGREAGSPERQTTPPDRVSQPQREQAKPANSGSPSAAKPNAIDSLLSASENEEAAERAAAAKEAARLAQLQSETTSQLSRMDTLSSLESCADKFDPGVKESTTLTPEQKRQRRREQIAQQMRQRIEERHRAADTARLQRVQEAERLHEAERAQHVPDRTQTGSDRTQTVPERTQTVPERTQTVPERTQTVPDRTQPTAEAAPAVQTDQSAALETSTAEVTSTRSERFTAEAEQPSANSAYAEPGTQIGAATHTNTGSHPNTTTHPAHSENPENISPDPSSTSETPHRVSIWDRLSDSPLSASTPEWIDDDPSDYRGSHVQTDDLVRGIPRFTDDDDVKATGILDVPTHGIEKEPNL